jgi:hypothetical protein
MPQWRIDHDGVENMTLAVMGCVVNGPGESKHANIGISLPGTGEAPAAPVFEDGAKTVTLRGDHIAAGFHRHRRCLRGAHLPKKADRADDALKIQSVRGNERHPAGRGRVLGDVRGHHPLVAQELRLPPDSPADRRADAAVQAGHRRGHRYRREGDVLLRRQPQRRAADAASGGHRRLRARGDPAQSDCPAGATALLHGPDVPARAATERALSAVPSGRRRITRLCRPGHRCRTDPDGCPPVG